MTVQDIEIVQIGPLIQWPDEIVRRRIENLSDIFYREKLWKFVHKNHLSEHIKTYDEESIFYKYKNDIEAHKDENLLIAQSPFDPQHTIFLARTSECQKTILNILEHLRHSYENRVSTTKTCLAREWCAYGSEKEVDEARVETTREKISVEWIGNLEKRYESVNFQDVDDYVGFPTDKKSYKVIKKHKLDIGLQVSVQSHNIHTQTNTCEIALEFMPDIGQGEDGTLQFEQSGFEETATGEMLTERIDQVYDVSLNYYKSFINMEKRTKKISSIAWHPTKSGYVAVAYITATEEHDDVISEKSRRFQEPLTHEARKIVNEQDIEFNESIFDMTTRKHSIRAGSDADDESGSETESVKDESEEEENDDESCVEGRFDSSSFVVYKQGVQLEASVPIIIDKSDPKSSDFFDADLKWASDMLQGENTLDGEKLVDDDASASTASGESLESDSSISSTLKSDFTLKVAQYEDTRSEDSDSIDDDLPITDTDSSVLLWSCENDLTPQLNLYNVHDIHVIKFYPVDGNLLAGGSCSGQLVVWDIHEELEKSKRQQPRLNEQTMISDFLENLPGWQTDDSKCPLIHPVAITKRNISHVDKITDLEWIHPSLKLSVTGTLVKPEGEHSKQILTASLDGTIKAWDMHSTRPTSESSFGENRAWSLQLIHNLNVSNPKLEKYSLSIEAFKMTIPPAQYQFISAKDCQLVPEINKKINFALILANMIGEIGVIKFPDKKDAFIESSASKLLPENCRHEWWAICHDSSISSLSQNYFFPNITLSTGGRIFALWNSDFKNGPIWWKQYPVDVSLTHGCFTPFHPGIMYIARSDGKVDIWNIIKQIHEPVLQIKASGYKIAVLSIVTPPCSEYQLGIADSNGIFHILKNRYDVEWDEADLKNVETFLKRAEECKKQLLYWNKHWKELSTITDEYGFQYKPQQKKKPFKYTAQKKQKYQTPEPSLPTEQLIDHPTEEKFLEKIAKSEHCEMLLQKMLTDTTITETSQFIKSPPPPLSINTIHNQYVQKNVHKMDGSKI